MDLGKLLKHASVGDHDSLDTLARALNRLGYPRGPMPEGYLKEMRERGMIPIRLLPKRGKIHFQARVSIPSSLGTNTSEGNPTHEYFRTLELEPSILCAPYGRYSSWDEDNVVPWSDVRVEDVCKKCMGLYENHGKGEPGLEPEGREISHWYGEHRLANAVTARGIYNALLGADPADLMDPFEPWQEDFKPERNNLPVWLLAGRHVLEHLKSLGGDTRELSGYLEMMEEFTRQVLRKAQLPEDHV